MRGRRTTAGDRGALAALALALLCAAPGAAAAAPSLSRGDAAFWTGPGDARSCGDRCWEVAFDVTQRADVLRLGVDHATVGEVWTVAASGPGGATSTFSPAAGLYSMEDVIDGPEPGRWTMRVTAAPEVADLRFRLRAKLEGETGLRAGDASLLLPNLQALPPYEFTFEYPVTNGTTDGAPVGAPVPAGRTACHPEEVAEEQAVRCLRMAFGVRNTGQGPMQLLLGGGQMPADQTLIQKILHADGSSSEREAGVAKYHKTHQHYHHDKAIGLTLWRVTDPARGGLEPAGAEHLKGFAHRNELLREWTVFYPLRDAVGFGLRSGWGDYYEWDRPGNYIDFGVNPDGRYVLRLVADPVSGIQESDEGDNTSYSMIDVAGETVTLLESGRGLDPWDRCKIVVPFGAEPDVAPTLRPADCPSDTSGLPGVAPVAAPAVPATKPPKPCRKLGKRRRGESRRAYAKRRAAVRRCRRAAARRRAGH